MLRSVIGKLDIKNGKSLQEQPRVMLLSQSLGNISSKPNFVSLVCQAFEGVHLSDDYCVALCKMLKLPFPHHLAFGVALALSDDPTVQQQGPNP